MVINQAPEIPGTKGRFEGKNGARANFEEIAEAYDQITWKPAEVEQLPDGRWLVLLDVSARGSGSGVPMEVKLAHLCRFNAQDRLERLDAYLDWDKARHAASTDSW